MYLFTINSSHCPPAHSYHQHRINGKHNRNQSIANVWHQYTEHCSDGKLNKHIHRDKNKCFLLAIPGKAKLIPIINRRFLNPKALMKKQCATPKAPIPCGNIFKFNKASPQHENNKPIRILRE